MTKSEVISSLKIKRGTDFIMWFNKYLIQNYFILHLNQINLKRQFNVLFHVYNENYAETIERNFILYFYFILCAFDESYFKKMKLCQAYY